MLLFLRSCAVAASCCATIPYFEQHSADFLQCCAIPMLQCERSRHWHLPSVRPLIVPGSHRSFSHLLCSLAAWFVWVHAIGSAASVGFCAFLLVLLSFVLNLFLLCAYARQDKEEHSSPYGHTLCPLPSGTSRPTSSHSSHRCGAGIFLLLTVRSIYPYHLLPFSVLTSLRRLINSIFDIMVHVCISVPFFSVRCLSPAKMLAAYSCLSRTF